MANRVKTGRRASPEECNAAQKWVNRYRLAEQSPDRRLCVNPERPTEEHVHIDADDPELLLIVLQDFADHGTFQAIDPLRIKRLVLRSEFETRIKAGTSRDDALEHLAEKYHCDRRTIERRMKVNDKP